MTKYAMTFHALINVKDRREALEVANKIENAVACSPELFYGAYDPIEIFDLDECELLEDGDEDGD